MCDVDDCADFWHEEWRRARKGHTCYSCRESVRPGDLYHHSAGKWDGEFNTYKHCARCWHIFHKLVNITHDAVALDLNCGETYEGDDSDMLALAFTLPDDEQPWAAEQRHSR